MSIRGLVARLSALALCACVGGSSGAGTAQPLPELSEDINPPGERLDHRARNYFPAEPGDEWTYDVHHEGGPGGETLTRTVTAGTGGDVFISEITRGKSTSTAYRRTPDGIVELRPWANIEPDSLAAHLMERAPPLPGALLPRGGHATRDPAGQLGPRLRRDQRTVVDVPELLARHARAYGTADATVATLPRTVRMEKELEGKKGVAERVLDKSAHRWEELIGGVHHATGTDANGAWVVGITGVPLRLRPAEATAVLFDPWFARRAYLSSFDAKRDTAICSEGDRDTPGPRVRLRYVLPEFGLPEIDFHLTTAALLSASAAASDGKRTITQYDAWAEADASGVRWPSAMTTGGSAGNRTKYRVIESVPRLACKGVGAKAPSTGDCLAMPTPALEIAWPPSGTVKVPMKHYLGELSLRVRTGDREAWALLDSGASLTVVDSTTPAGTSFVSNLEMNGSGASQKIRAGLGELSTLRIGDLTLTHLPAASIPIPALDSFGNRRPEIIVGFSLFLGAAVRVDYAKARSRLGSTVGHREAHSQELGGAGGLRDRRSSPLGRRRTRGG